MKTEVHKITFMVVDFDQLGADQVIFTLENARYPNRCIAPGVMNAETIQVDWHDEHPLNNKYLKFDAFDNIFKEETK